MAQTFQGDISAFVSFVPLWLINNANHGLRNSEAVKSMYSNYLLCIF
jgi:hypothetical protein